MENNSRNKSIALIVELFMLFSILLLVIVVITQTLVMTRGRSVQARHLNEAVIAAENTMEVVFANSDDGSVDQTFDMVFDGDGESGETYEVTVTTEEEKGKTGSFKVFEVTVSLKGSDKPLYTLKSGDYERGRS